MKDRRPRKLKKVLKNRFERSNCNKITQCCTVSVISAMQFAFVQSRPTSKEQLPEKASRLVSMAVAAAQSIKQIMSSGPKNWRDA